MPKLRNNKDDEALRGRIKQLITRSGYSDAKVGQAMGFKHRSQITTRLNGPTGWSQQDIENLSAALTLSHEEHAELLELAGYIVYLEPELPALLQEPYQPALAADTFRLNKDVAPPKGDAFEWRRLIEQGQLAIVLGGVFLAALFGLVVWQLWPQPPAAPVVAMTHYWNPQRLDNHLVVSAVSSQKARAEGYVQDSTVQGFVFAVSQPGTTPLCLYFNPAREDYVVVARQETRQQLEAKGYRLEECAGYVYPDAQAGTVPLQLYVNDQRGDYFATATQQGQQAAKRAGYSLVGEEGFVFFPSRELTSREQGWRRVCARDLSVLRNFGGPKIGELYQRSNDRFYELGRYQQRSYGYAQGDKFQGVGWVITEYLC